MTRMLLAVSAQMARMRPCSKLPGSSGSVVLCEAICRLARRPPLCITTSQMNHAGGEYALSRVVGCLSVRQGETGG